MNSREKQGTQIDIEEGVRVVKLKNSKGQVMYIVTLFQQNDGKYVVKVKEVTDLYVPRDIIREIYDCTEEGKKMAISQFKVLIGDYKTLVQCEEQKWPNPKDVFDDAVQYHTINPDCCLNCEYSMFEPVIYDRERIPHEPEMFCYNCKNMKYYEELDREYRKQKCGCDNRKPHMKTRIHIDKDGYCNNYSRYNGYRPKYEPKSEFENDRDLIDLIATMQENRLRMFEQEIYVNSDGTTNQNFETNVLKVVSANISSTLSDEVGNVVYNALSSERGYNEISAITYKIIEEIIDD